MVIKRPNQTGWQAQFLGKNTTHWSMTRHASHLSRRPYYDETNREDDGTISSGILASEGSGHRLYHNEVGEVAEGVGDHPTVPGGIQAGALLYTEGERTSDDILAKARTVARGEFVPG